MTASEPLSENGRNTIILFEEGFVCTSKYDGAWNLWENSGDPVAWMYTPAPYIVIHSYRYCISLGCMNEDVVSVQEKAKSYIGEGFRFLKSEDGVADIRDRTSYPYITFYSTKNPSREYAVRKIKEFFSKKWGLN